MANEVKQSSTVNQSDAETLKKKQESIFGAGINERTPCHQHCSHFPKEVFPGVIQDFIEQCHQRLHFQPAQTGGAILFAGSIAIGNTHHARVKNTEKEQPCLYIANIAPKSAFKSPPLNYAMHPIRKREQRYKEEYQQRYKEYQENDEQKDPPKRTRLEIQTVTPERASSINNESPRGIGMVRQELAGWIQGMDQYRKGGEMDFWIENWSGNPHKRDTQEESNDNYAPFISIYGDLQTGRVPLLGGKDGEVSGFTSRWLFIHVNQQKRRKSDDEVDEDKLKAYNRTIYNLLDLEEDAKELPYTPEAREYYFQWVHELEERGNNHVENNQEELAGVVYKYDMIISRLAVILQLMRWAASETSEANYIELETVQKAGKLADYFVDTSIYVHNLINDPYAGLPELQRNWLKSLPENFETNEAVTAGQELDISERTIKDWLKSSKYLKRIKQGKYKKLP